MPTHYELRVSETVHASVDDVRDFLSDLSNFQSWNPFLAMDSNSVIQVSSPSVGVGASYSWDSKKIGSGVMTITGVSETCIDIHMKFTSRNKREDDVQWLLEQTPDGTAVTWAMSGVRSLGERVFVGLLRLDKVMSGHFADGLKQLKATLEK